jgi:YidC/Oxa1 family membrane protein insertase
MSERNPFNPGENDGAMQRRTLLAFVLMGIVLFGMPYFFKSAVPQQPVKNAKTAPAPKPVATGPVVAQSALPPTPSSTSPATPSSSPALTAAHSEEQVVIDTDVYRIVFSNRGGVVKSWTLKKYPNAAGKPLEVVNDAAADKVYYPFTVEYRAAPPPVELNQSLFVATKAPDGFGVTFEFADKGVAAKKTFTFQRNSYLTKVNSDISLNGAPVPHLLAWHGGFGDFAVQNASGYQHAIRYDLGEQKGFHFSLTDSKLVTDGAKTAKDHSVERDGQFSFVGLEDQYFAAVFLPEGNGNVQTTLYDDYVPTQYDKSIQQFIGNAVGGQGDNKLELFIGPKDLQLLKQVNPKLEQIVDFGTFWFLAKPLFLVLRWINQQWLHNYGWSIVLITIFINFLLFPLRLTNMKSMKKMQSLQPKIAEINARYKDMSLRDPRMSQKNAETMELYKQNGANPMGGCLPMLIQMPFLFAFYKVLAVSISMRDASWLWVGDLSQPEHLGLRVLPIVMIITSFLMQRMTPTTGMDPSQQRMMMFMPLIMGFFFYNQSSGLVLYWLTGNLMGIAQQYFFNKTIVTTPPPQLVKAAASRAPVKKPVRR